MSPGQVQAAMVAAVLLLSVVAVAVVVWRRRGGGAVVVASRLHAEAAQGIPGASRAAGAPADFVWSPPDATVDSAPADGRRPRPRIEARLEIAARLLGARGLIVWRVDAAESRLTVHASVGYPPSYLEETGPIALDAPVLAATACQERSLQTRRRRGWHLAAIAVPLVHDDRLLGVLTAEMTPETGDEVSADGEALFRGLALQLAPGMAAELSTAATAGDAPASGPPAAASERAGAERGRIGS